MPSNRDVGVSGWIDFNKLIAYDTYRIEVATGKIVVKLLIGRGFYACNSNVWETCSRIAHPRMAFRPCLHPARRIMMSTAVYPRVPRAVSTLEK